MTEIGLSEPVALGRAFLGSGHGRNERKTWFIVGLSAGMAVLEIAGGGLFGSLALVADGLHMTTHAAAFLIAALAYAYARTHADDPAFTFGTGKLGDLAGFASAIVLAMVALLIGYEAVDRLINPVTVDFAIAIPTAILGLAVNLASAWVLSDGPDAGGAATQRDNNMQAAFAHILADVAVSVLAILGLGAGRLLGWTWLDPVMGLVGMGVIASWSWRLIRDAGAVLLDMSPDRALEARIAAEIAEGGDRLDELRLWRLGPGHLGALLSITSAKPAEPDHYRARLRRLGPLSHITIELRQAA
jgi:cation diffusion facilitator family transporter